MNQKLLTEDEVADMLGISPRTLQYWRQQRINIPFVKVGKQVRYRVEKVEAFMNTNSQAVFYDGAIIR